MNNSHSILIHREIILDLTIRTLERDCKHIETLKMKNAFHLWIESKVKELQNDLRNTKSELHKTGIKIQSRLSEDSFTTYSILVKGNIHTVRYSNIALRNWTEEEVKRLLGLELTTI